MKSSSEKVFQDVNPADIQDVLGEFQSSSKEDVKRAIDLAEEAQRGWAEASPSARAKILYKVSDLIEAQREEFSRILTREEGKTIKESRVEVTRSADVFRFYAGQASRLNGKTISSDDRKMLLYTMKVPLGVVSIITPWNFPIVIPSWKIAPALISGNSVVFKPASLTPLVGLKLAEILIQSGLPKGVVNFVTGSGSAVGDEMVRNRKIAGVSFTGSCGVGEGIRESCYVSPRKPRVQLEMGGKNPTIVLESADLDAAVSVVSAAAFGLTGQACTATSRAIVEESVYSRFVEKIKDKASSIRVGNGLDETTEMGSTASKSELEKDLEYVKIGVEEGARLLDGGSQLRGHGYSNGFFIQPTVFADVTPDMRIAQEEIFGPILSVMRAKDFDEAVKLANTADFGLAAAICTRDLGKALEFADKVEAGVVKVNRTTTGIAYNAPFGGMKKSSSETFKEQGEEAIDFYTHTKTVYLGY